MAILRLCICSRYINDTLYNAETYLVKEVSIIRDVVAFETRIDQVVLGWFHRNSYRRPVLMNYRRYNAIICLHIIIIYHILRYWWLRLLSRYLIRHAPSSKEGKYILSRPGIVGKRSWTGKKYNANTICFNCRRKGHAVADCPKAKSVDGDTKSIGGNMLQVQLY